jgi:hypothetical protein
MRKRRFSFTLFEILMTLLLISVALAGIGFKAPALFRQERFERGAERLINQIALAQEIMLAYQTDVTLSMCLYEKGVICTYDVSTPEVRRVLRKKIGRPLFVKGIEGLYFDEKKVDKVILSFQIENCSTTQGRLSFQCRERKVTCHLPGFPVSLHKEKEKKEYAKKLSPAVYPQI